MKKIRFMDTSFRDGFQSCYGARVATKDFLPALEASVDAGIEYLEAGGGARFQSLFFYCGESAYDMMDTFREVAGPKANLQTLARGINVVALSQQPKDIIDLHAKMFKKHGMTTIRNFDALNDVRNLKYSSERITHHGLKNQICVTMMDLPPGCEGAHTPEFYMTALKNILKEEVPFDSVCFKDASGTSNPNKVYETIKQARKLLGKDATIWFHTHDTAGCGIAQYTAAVNAGITGIDLSKSPVSGGTCQPDILTMWHALKGTDYTLDVDYEKILKAEEVFQDCMKDYMTPPEAKMTSPNIPLSPMPGGALTANTMMMRDTNTLHLYPQVIKAMSEVVKKGGFGSSVTPVSQFYFQQAYLNAVMGPWKKINPQYGNMVLGYFGRTPAEPDPEIVKIASEQLGKPVFKEDPLDILEPGIPKATKILEENGLEVNDENIFVIASCEQKGLDFLLGKATTNIRKISEEKAKEREQLVAEIKKDMPAPAAAPQGPRAYSITVDGRTYGVAVNEGVAGAVAAAPVQPPVAAAPAAAAPAAPVVGTDVKAPTPGLVLKLYVEEGEEVEEGQTILVLEAMKMETDIKSPKSGKVAAVHVSAGEAVQTDAPLITIS